MPSEKTSLKLVLKVGGAPSTPEVVIDSMTDDNFSDTDRKQRHKKKKRHHEKHGHRHHDKKKQEADLEDGEDSEDDEEPAQKRPHLDEEDDEDQLHVRHLREKKSNEDNKTPLQLCLSYLHKLLQRKDTNGFFAFPVTDNIAPGYSSIISCPMDFSTMKVKIDDGSYHSVAEFKADYELMMTNCMSYNHPDTIYHKEAKRLLSVGLKHMSREKLVHMKRGLPFMAGVTKEELGFEDEGTGTSDDTSAGQAESHKMAANKMAANKTDAKTKELRNVGKFEAIPDDLTPEEILEQVQRAADEAANALEIRSPNSKIGFLRRKEDGTTTLNILNPDDDGFVSEKERVVNLGSLVGKLATGTSSLLGFKEDKRNKINPVIYLDYGAFSSFAPVYDSSTANISKEESDLLLSTYADEIGLQYAKSLSHFVADAGDYTISMVDDLLNVLTSGEHSKVMAKLQLQEENEKQDEEEVEMIEMQTSSTAVQGVVDEANPSQNQTTGQTKAGVDDDLGIEMFLQSFVDSGLQNTGAHDGSQETQKKLEQTSELILNLQRTQYERLSEKLPEHLSDVRDPSKEEIDLANKVTTQLTELVKQVKPVDVVQLKSVRSAMGIAILPDDGGSNTPVTSSSSSSWHSASQSASQSSPYVISDKKEDGEKTEETSHHGDDLLDLLQQGTTSDQEESENQHTETATEQQQNFDTS